MPKTVTLLQVFVASPADVAEERDVLEEIIRELNLIWANKQGIRLELFRWETQVAPGFGDDAQDVINKQISDSYDIFIGIMWTRFGTPTTRAGSGTEEEFQRAYDRYIKDPKSVEIMFYFKDAPVSPSLLDLNQLQSINDFRSRFGELGGLYAEFKSLDEFRNNIRIHLSSVVQNWSKQLKETGIKQTITTQHEVSGTDIIEHDEEEEGFLDLIESAEDSMSNVTEVLMRMASVTKELGEKSSERAEEMNSLVTPSGSPNRKAAKRVAMKAANDLEGFVMRMNDEIPRYSNSFTTAMNSFGRAATLTTDFGIDNSDDLQEVFDSVEDLRSAINKTHSQIQTLRGIVADLPRMTTVFNRARRIATATLDTLLDELTGSNRQAKDVEDLLSELIEQCKTKEGLSLISDS
ncbi:MAG: DUF4062 domain-containing protein [Candidatus Electryonea clarkiae]|nr:DUF4062 domain-containing protein [Candidatus Electryonea clarkiae]MDP8288442.1 DUF4062 domain-containing protein [Candidatus Electryonea clarkiae]